MLSDSIESNCFLCSLEGIHLPLHRRSQSLVHNHSTNQNMKWLVVYTAFVEFAGRDAQTSQFFGHFLPYQSKGVTLHLSTARGILAGLR